MRRKKDAQERYVTIKDVAKEADVSIATVSRVINNGRVRSEKKKKVLEAIRKLDYVPNESARNLAAVTVTKRIAYVIPGIDRTLYTDMIKGSQDILETYSYDPVINIYNYDFEKYKQLNQKLKLTGEFKAIIQLGELLELENKLAINWLDENLVFREIANSEDFAVYTSDEFMEEFLRSTFLPGMGRVDDEEVMNSDYKAFIAPSLKEAMHLYNLGVVDKDIYTFEDISEAEKLCDNLKQMELDFYGLGVALSRIAIKMTRGESINKVLFVLRGINE